MSSPRARRLRTSRLGGGISSGINRLVPRGSHTLALLVLATLAMGAAVWLAPDSSRWSP